MLAQKANKASRFAAASQGGLANLTQCDGLANRLRPAPHQKRHRPSGNLPNISIALTHGQLWQATHLTYAFWLFCDAAKKTSCSSHRNAAASFEGGPAQETGKMTTLDTNRPVAGSTSILSLFSGMFSAMAAWNDARITRKSLSKLTARELDDIGLCRGDIDVISVRGSRF
jgi:uncharacterized protein YjiS (DUF1127 family)